MMIKPPATLNAKKTMKIHTPKRIQKLRRARWTFVWWVGRLRLTAPSFAASSPTTVPNCKTRAAPA